MQSGVAFHHELLLGGRVMIATDDHIYTFEDNELLQTINLAK